MIPKIRNFFFGKKEDWHTFLSRQISAWKLLFCSFGAFYIVTVSLTLNLLFRANKKADRLVAQFSWFSLRGNQTVYTTNEPNNLQ